MVSCSLWESGLRPVNLGLFGKGLLKELELSLIVSYFEQIV